MCPIKCTTIRWNKYFLILKCFNWRRTDIFLVWNVQKCSSLYWITFIHMPISMWSGFMWIHGTVNWLSQTCFTVDMENIMNVNIEIWKYFVNFKKLIPFQKYEAFFFQSHLARSFFGQDNSIFSSALYYWSDKRCRPYEPHISFMK